MTHARTSLEKPVDGHGRNMSGQSYQLKYSKFIAQSGSNISVAAYRFSTDGYMDYMTAMNHDPGGVVRSRRRLAARR